MFCILTREEALEDIKDNKLPTIRNEILTELEKDFKNNKENLASKFLEDFYRICENIVVLQEKGRIGEIKFIIFTVLRTRLIEENYKFPVIVCNKFWWMDEKHLEVGTFDSSFVFKYYEKMKKELEKVRNVYIGKTIKQDVDSLLNDEIVNFMYYLARIAKYKILVATESEMFKNISKTNNIQIHVGEYFDFSEIIFNEYYEEKNIKEINEKISSGKRNEVCFWDMKSLDFSNQEFIDVDLRFSDVRYCDFSNTDMSYSLLAGTIFNYANLENANLSFSVLNEASFENANCRGVQFNKIIGYSGLEDQKNWDMVGYYPLNFKNANLENADFQGADIIGSVFDGAILDGAIFDKEQLGYLNLSDEQRKVIKEV